MNGLALRRKTIILGLIVTIIFLLVGAGWTASVEERFPPPDFGPDYEYPYKSQTPARQGWKAWMDTGVLAIALIVATFFIYKLRSRKAMLGMTIFAVLYFGFYRRGCVCPIGAIGNVSMAIFDPTYALPGFVLLFFLLPLVLSIFYGRVFCAGVCPLGAMQELILVKPIRVPRYLDEGLSIIRYFYLGFAVLFAALGSQLIICQYDPFVSFWRFSAQFYLWVISIAFIILCMFVGRAYCRYLCPYGALLSLLSRFSWKHVTITPDKCVVCGLCRDACPFGAIRESDKKLEEGA
ncbi:MAG: 4Fe-4S binding protein [Candidatus Sumerlaeia bacterium]